MNIVMCVINAFARIGVRAILDEHADMSVLAETGTSDELCAAAEHAAEHAADIVIIDSAVAFTPALASLAALGNADRPAVIALAGDIRPRRLAELLRREVRGIVSADDAPGHLIQAVRTAAAGGIYVSPVLAGCVAHAVAAPAPAQAVTRRRVLEQLTPRETEILGLVAEGKSNQEIAEQLTLSEKTVKFHVSSILAKSDARSRAQLIAAVANLPDGPDGLAGWPDAAAAGPGR